METHQTLALLGRRKMAWKIQPDACLHGTSLPWERDQQMPPSNHLQSPAVVQLSPLVTQLPHPHVFLACLGKIFLVFPHIRISPVASCNQHGWGFFLSHFPHGAFCGQALLRCWMGATKRKGKQVVKNWRCFSFCFSVLATITEMPHQSHPLWKTWAGTNTEAHLLSNTWCQQTVSKPQAEAHRYGKGSQLHRQASREGQGRVAFPQQAGATSRAHFFPFGQLHTVATCFRISCLLKSCSDAPSTSAPLDKDPVCKNTFPWAQEQHL